MTKKQYTGEVIITALVLVLVAIFVVVQIVESEPSSPVAYVFNFITFQLFNVEPAGVENSVAAYVNGDSITVEELEQATKLSGETTYSQTDILDQLVHQKLIEQDAARLGLVATEEDYNQAMANFYLSTDRTKEDIETLLAAQNLTFEEFKADLMKQLLITEYINITVLSKVEVPKEEITAYYEQNKDMFVEPEKVHAAHIIVNSSVTAQELKTRINQGEVFEELAKEYSFDGSAQSGGDLGWFTRDMMVPEFADVAFAMEIGEVSDVVESQFGFHLIKLYNKTETYHYTFDEVKEAIRMELAAPKQGEMLIQHLSDLRGKADVQILLEGINSFRNTGVEVCSEDEKPVFRLFTTSTCPHCKWIKDTFREVVESNDVMGYIWELDTGDNLMTEEVETEVPTLEKELFYSLSPSRGVPAFSLGCKFIRIGNGYEAQNNLEREKQDMIEVINMLT